MYSKLCYTTLAKTFFHPFPARDKTPQNRRKTAAKPLKKRFGKAAKTRYIKRAREKYNRKKREKYESL